MCGSYDVVEADGFIDLLSSSFVSADWMQEARVKWLDEVRSELSKIAPEEDFDAVMAAGTIQYMVRSQFTTKGERK
mgnify:CR=1 FL=1